MTNWVTKYFLPFLVIALIVALYFDSSSVEKVDLDSSYNEPVAVAPIQPRTASRPPLTREPQASALVTKSRLAIGVRYNSLKDLEADLRAQGFIRTGYFGKFWPASVAEIATGRNEIKFVRQDRTPHHYKGFDGYNMKMVRLWRGNKETIVVFRSEEKR
ncbi:hypothetical protein P9J64_03150 [Deltaproteobacteria bacterium IMCC39524]|nr:hypothetical protein [Deltaproteobacteria bacterium IMCC39524]